MNPYDMRSTATGRARARPPAAAASLATVALGNDTTTGAFLRPRRPPAWSRPPTQGLLSRSGIMLTAISQDTPGPTGRSRADVASTLFRARRHRLPRHAGQDALDGKRIAVVTNTDAAYTEASPPSPISGPRDHGRAPSTTAPAQVIDREFKRDVNAFLASFGTSLADVIAFNNAHPTETKKFTQARLEAADNPDLTNYESDFAAGLTATARCPRCPTRRRGRDLQHGREHRHPGRPRGLPGRHRSRRLHDQLPSPRHRRVHRRRGQGRGPARVAYAYEREAQSATRRRSSTRRRGTAWRPSSRRAGGTATDRAPRRRRAAP